MPTTTRQLAKIAAISEQTVRNYTRDYAELLSPKGRGDAGSRLFSDEDVQILCTVATLRKDEVPRDEIIDRLRRGDVVIDATPTPQQATPSPQTALDAPQMLMVVRSELQRQINEIKHTQSVLVRGALLWGMVLGAIGGLAFGAFVLWLLWLLTG